MAWTLQNSGMVLQRSTTFACNTMVIAKDGSLVVVWLFARAMSFSTHNLQHALTLSLLSAVTVHSVTLYAV